MNPFGHGRELSLSYQEAEKELYISYLQDFIPGYGLPDAVATGDRAGRKQIVTAKR